MNNFDNTKNAPNANEFLGGNFLRKEDLEGPVTVTITDVSSEAIMGSLQKKLIIAFREFEKPLILNKTNIAALVQMFGTGDTTAWRGQLTLFVDPSVQYAGRVVGGIRLRRAATQPVATEARPAPVNHQPVTEQGNRLSHVNGREAGDIDFI